MASAIQVVLDDKMRVAMDGLDKAAVKMKYCEIELRIQGYTVQADALLAIYNSLVAEIALIDAAL